jgi:hypothetical protein
LTSSFSFEFIGAQEFINDMKLPTFISLLLQKQFG